MSVKKLITRCAAVAILLTPVWLIPGFLWQQHFESYGGVHPGDVWVTLGPEDPFVQFYRRTNTVLRISGRYVQYLSQRTDRGGEVESELISMFKYRSKRISKGK